MRSTGNTEVSVPITLWLLEVNRCFYLFRQRRAAVTTNYHSRKHSQSRNSSSCPPSFTEVYNGYSFVFPVQLHFLRRYNFGVVENVDLCDDGFRLMSAGVDLGGTGSCLRVFAPLPFVSCTRETCDSDDRTGYR